MCLNKRFKQQLKNGVLKMSINNDINVQNDNDNNALKIAYNLVKNSINLTLTQYKRRFYKLNGDNVRSLTLNELNRFNTLLIINANTRNDLNV